MALTEYTITDADVGAALPITDGYLVSLRLVTPPPRYEVPEGNDGSGIWLRGYLQLRGSLDVRDIYCSSPHSWGNLSPVLIINQSLGFRGQLKILCVPRGSVFSITLSDQPVDRTFVADPSSRAAFGAALLATVMAEQAERELVPR